MVDASIDFSNSWEQGETLESILEEAKMRELDLQSATDLISQEDFFEWVSKLRTHYELHSTLINSYLHLSISCIDYLNPNHGPQRLNEVVNLLKSLGINDKDLGLYRTLYLSQSRLLEFSKGITAEELSAIDESAENSWTEYRTNTWKNLYSDNREQFDLLFILHLRSKRENWGNVDKRWEELHAAREQLSLKGISRDEMSRVLKLFEVEEDLQFSFTRKAKEAEM